MSVYVATFLSVQLTYTSIYLLEQKSKKKMEQRVVNVYKECGTIIYSLSSKERKKPKKDDERDVALNYIDDKRKRANARTKRRNGLLSKMAQLTLTTGDNVFIEFYHAELGGIPKIFSTTLEILQQKATVKSVISNLAIPPMPATNVNQLTALLTPSEKSTTSSPGTSTLSQALLTPSGTSTTSSPGTSTLSHALLTPPAEASTISQSTEGSSMAIQEQPIQNTQSEFDRLLQTSNNITEDTLDNFLLENSPSSNITTRKGYDRSTCQICKAKYGEPDDIESPWVECSARRCNYNIHFLCIGFEFKKRTEEQEKSDFKFYCPVHREAKLSQVRKKLIK